MFYRVSPYTEKLWEFEDRGNEFYADGDPDIKTLLFVVGKDRLTQIWNKYKSNIDIKFTIFVTTTASTEDSMYDLEYKNKITIKISNASLPTPNKTQYDEVYNTIEDGDIILSNAIIPDYEMLILAVIIYQLYLNKDFTPVQVNGNNNKTPYQFADLRFEEIYNFFDAVKDF